ncbi:MAG: acyl-CoA dehydrogenase family protein [Pseudomonadales bacterium]|nr:acyl-CoA dehydrogenase family protein [Pseudomonadales bacterium]MCP5185931.1 acyl-CoA dehydrogenase family protein [Pseudomonadales bacterium]
MNFDLSEEQQLIVDSVRRFVDDNYDLEKRKKYTSSTRGFGDDNWRTMAELGWLGLPFGEADGGFGGNQIDVMLVMEQFGRGLVVEPYLPSVVLGGGAVRRGGSAALRSTIVPAIIDGSAQLALATMEDQSRFDLNDVLTRAGDDGDHWTLSGSKTMVINGGSATHLVVSCRTAGAQYDEAGITLLLVDATASGVEHRSFATVDGLQAAEITFNNVQVPRDNTLGEPGNGYALLHDVMLDGILAICAEAVGAMEMLYKDTIEYTQQRVQFDHPLSDFQVLQHRMVEMFMEYEQCKSMLLRATMEVAASGSGATRTVHALKALVGKQAIFVGENAVQLHGGMGMTEELRIGHYFKRLLVIDAMFGNADHHLYRFAA